MMNYNNGFSLEEIKSIKKAYINKEFKYFPATDKNKLAKLFPWDVVNKILYQYRLSSPRLRIHKDGLALPENLYTDTIFARRQYTYVQINEIKLYEQLRQRGTLVIDAVDELYDPLTEFISFFERTIANRIQANAYMSWKKVRGFTTHWDDNDVFILQIYGRKDWYLFGETRKSPLYKDFHPSDEPPTKCVWNKIIEAGDVLFIPRGHWHHAIAVDKPSMHLTLGVSVKSGIQLISWLQEKMTEIELFRSDIPLLQDEDTVIKYEAEIKNELFKLLNNISLSEYKSYVETKLDKRTRFSLPYAINEVILPEGTNFQLVINFLLLIVVDNDDDTFTIVANTKKYTISSKCKPIFNLLLDYQFHVFQELLDANINKVDEKELKFLFGKLVLEGLIAIKGIHE